MAPLPLLQGEDLLQLARLVRNQENVALNNIIFKSETEQADYLRTVKDNYNNTIKLLDDAEALMATYKDDETKSSIAHDTFNYVQKGVNVSLQGVRNCTVRSSYLSKMSSHSSEIIEAIKVLDPTDVETVARLAEEAMQYNQSMEQLMLNHQSTASKNFSKLLKDSGTTFEELVTKYQAKRGFPGLFKNLKDEEKLLVYNDIIVASGRGSVLKDTISTVTGIAGIAVLLLAVGVMVWDIFTSDHAFETATRDVMTTVAAVGGAMVGEVVGVAVPTLIGIEATSIFVTATAIIGSFVGAFMIGAFVGWFLDFIFGTGGEYPLSTDGHTCYVAPLPDGEGIARQIIHD